MIAFPITTSPALLSPMAGVTDVAFRALAKKYGAGMTYTEFVSSTAVVRGSKKTLEVIRTDPSERPVAVQLFGHSVDDVVAAAKLLENQFDVIDINCGCPAWKVIKSGAGSAMLNDPRKIGDFIQRLTAAVTKPVTVKIRAGIDDQHINAVEVAKIAEKAGAAAIGVHGRTQEQGYSGKANWAIVRAVKRVVSIPVIGNGDVFSPEDFKEKLEYSGCDYILIARCAMGNPSLFKQISDYLKKGTYETVSRITQFMEYAELAEKYNLPFPLIRSHAMEFTKGMVGGAALRRAIMKCRDKDLLLELMNKEVNNEASEASKKQGS